MMMSVVMVVVVVVEVAVDGSQYCINMEGAHYYNYTEYDEYTQHPVQ